MDNIKQFVKPFAKATVDCFDQMVGVALRLKNIEYIDHRYRQDGIYANIGFVGDAQGMIAISLSEEAAIQVISRFSGETASAIDEEAIDAVGEIINIIAGGKSLIQGVRLTMSLPSVIYGRPLWISLPRDVPIISTTFEANGIGDVTLFVCMQAN
ncbi:MAG: chemotaxis protein CheX [Myxococcales bacterium]|nr:MAG: chemotaxis protein CheX [Myxococcales bacterium]